ncbi:dTMP kinase [Mesoaciditoga sp.]
MPLITFEGIDGCGKTTQIKKLSDYLKNKKVNFSVFREPGGTNIGEKIRKILLDSSNNNMDEKTEFLLYVASRSQLVKEQVKPRLEVGEYVILDRYIDSSVAYQGFGRGLGKRIVTLINEFATDMIYPDLTFYLEIDKETFEKRMRIKDRLEAEGWEFMKKVIEGYNSLKGAKRFILIDGREPEDKIFRRIIEELEKHFAL